MSAGEVRPLEPQTVDDARSLRAWLSRWKEWFRSATLWRVIIPVVFGLLSLVWTSPLGSLVYGQDSLSFFIQPFNYNFSPLSPYSYLYSSTAPLYDTSQFLYIEAFAAAIHHLGASDAVTEHVLLVIGTALGVYGLLDLIHIAARLTGRSVSTSASILATAFYVFNPFGLSAIWWHIQAFSVLQVLAPFLVSLLITVIYSPRLPVLRVLCTVALAIVLAPGVTDVYAISVGIVIVYAICYLVCRGVDHRCSLREIAVRAGVLVACAVGMLGWANIGLLEAGQKYGFGYLTGTNVYQEFLIQSRYTSLQHVWTLLAVSWIYTFPNAYGWSTFLPWLAIAGLLCPLLLLTSALYLGQRPSIRFMLPLVLVLILISLGNNSPGAAINSSLVSMAGLFSFLINPYYFVTQFVVVFLAIGVYEVWSSLQERLILTVKHATVGRPRGVGDAFPLLNVLRPFQSTWHDPRGERSRGIGVQTLSIAICLGLIVAALSIMAFPFISHQVYVTSGPNTDQFPLPDSFYQLQAFFQQNYTGPDYFALILPIAASGTAWITIGNGSLVDSSQLIANFIPYPLFYAGTNSLTLALDNVLVSGDFQNLTGLLSGLHIKFVVLNPYSNLSAPSMSSSPNGSVLNLSSLQRSLNDSIGGGDDVGSFVVYTVPHVLPLAYPVSEPTVFVSQGMGTYLGLLGGVVSGPQWFRSSLTSAVWSDTTASLSQYDGGEVYPLPSSDSSTTLENDSLPLIVNNSGVAETWNASGNSTGLPGVGWNPSAHAVTIRGERFATTANVSGNLTDLPLVNGSYYNPIGSAGTVGWWLNAPAPPVWIQTHVRVLTLSPRNWIELRLDSGPVTILVTLYNQGTMNESAIQATAYFEGTPYAWNNTLFPSVAYNQNLTMNVWLNTTSVRIALVSSALVLSSTFWDNLVYQGPNLDLNAGSNLSALPPNHVYLSSYSVNLVLNQVNAILQSTNISRPPPYTFLIAWHGARSSDLLAQTLTYDSDGGYSSSVNTLSTPAFDYVLAFPLVSYWQLTSSQGFVQKITSLVAANVFSIMGPLSQNLTRIKLSFNGPYAEATAASVWELSALITASIALLLLQRFIWRPPKLDVKWTRQ